MVRSTPFLYGEREAVSDQLYEVVPFPEAQIKVKLASNQYVYDLSYGVQLKHRYPPLFFALLDVYAE
jgi:hypothetical protein